MMDECVKLCPKEAKARKKGLRYYLESCHREFDYVTCCSMLEPWEKRIVKGTLLTLTLVTAFSR